jgi:hypothetical protein
LREREYLLVEEDFSTEKRRPGIERERERKESFRLGPWGGCRGWTHHEHIERWT